MRFYMTTTSVLLGFYSHSRVADLFVGLLVFVRAVYLSKVSKVALHQKVSINVPRFPPSLED